MECDNDFCGVLLAGGRSSRIGRNKALIDVGGRPLIRTVADALLSVTGEVVVAANEAHTYAFLGLPVILDKFSGQGPLAGLHAAMVQSTRDYFLLLACDLPNVCGGVLQCLVKELKHSQCDVVVPCTADGRVHPLCAAYCRSCLPHIEQNLVLGANKVLKLLENDQLRVHWWKPEVDGYKSSYFANINYRSDLESFLHAGDNP